MFLVVNNFTGSLGYYIAVMVTPPAIGRSSLGGEKYTASRFRDREEEPDEEEEPRKCI